MVSVATAHPLGGFSCPGHQCTALAWLVIVLGEKQSCFGADDTTQSQLPMSSTVAWATLAAQEVS